METPDFAIGILRPKFSDNIGTLQRSAYQLGATGTFVIEPRCRVSKATKGDTLGAGKHIEFAEHASFDAFRASIPVGTVVIAIEKGGKPLANFIHPPKALYLLGPEDYGLSEEELRSCDEVITIESVRDSMYNVSVAGSIVLYHRHLQSFGTHSIRELSDNDHAAS